MHRTVNFMKQKRIWFLLFLVAFLLRLAMAGYWQLRCGDTPLYFGDSDTYWELGRTIARGEPYVYDHKAIHRMPGYPVLLAPMFLIFGDAMPVFFARIQNALIGALTVLAVAWLTRLLFHDRRISLIAAGITAIDPLNVVLSVLVLSEAPFCLAMVLQIGFWIKGFQAWEKSASPGKLGKAGGMLVLSGLFTAAAIYCRPSWLYFVPFAMMAGLILSPWRFRALLGSAAVIAAVCSLCLSPWWIRNYQVSGHFVSTTLQTGPSLYDGLSPTATGGSDMKFVEDFLNAESTLAPKDSDRTLEYRLNQKMREAAIRWAKAHPKLAFKLACKKFVRLWNVWPNEPSFSSLPVKAAVFCAYFPVLVFGVIGAVLTLRKGFEVWLLWIPAFYITGLHVIFVSSIRYRAPAMICLAILAAWVLVGIFKRRQP